MDGGTSPSTSILGGRKAWKLFVVRKSVLKCVAAMKSTPLAQDMPKFASGSERYFNLKENKIKNAADNWTFLLNKLVAHISQGFFFNIKCWVASVPWWLKASLSTLYLISPGNPASAQIKHSSWIRPWFPERNQHLILSPEPDCSLSSHPSLLIPHFERVEGRAEPKE